MDNNGQQSAVLRASLMPFLDESNVDTKEHKNCSLFELAKAITNDGNFRSECWHFQVRYWELYEAVPLFTNSATAEYAVYQDSNSEVPTNENQILQQQKTSQIENTTKGLLILNGGS